MDKSEEVRQWFAIADGDLRSAEYLMTLHYPRPDNVICFLCQQSAEKYLKGFLTVNEIGFPKTHSLLALLEIAKALIEVDSIIIDKCSFLTLFSIEPRYPNQREYTDDEVKLAIKYAKDIQTFIKGLLNDNMGELKDEE